VCGSGIRASALLLRKLCLRRSMPSLVDCVLAPRGDQVGGGAPRTRSPLSPAAGPSPLGRPASQVCHQEFSHEVVPSPIDAMP